MIKYFIEKKVEKEVDQNGKKVLVFAGAVITGIGVYASYKAIKKYIRKSKQDDNESAHYLIDSEYDIYNYDDIENNEKSELEEKINEFNSRRINSDNSNHASQEEMSNYVNSAQDTKNEVEINKEDYKEEQYDKYEYYEDDLEKK